jgi:hypothetical protein
VPGMPQSAAGAQTPGPRKPAMKRKRRTTCIHGRKIRSSMRHFLVRNILAAFVLAPLLGVAHTTNMTTVTMTLAETGAFEMIVEFDPGEKILGYPRYYEISRLEEPARSAALASITEQIEREVRLSFDGGRVLLQVIGWTLPNAPYEAFVDTTTPTMSQIRIKGEGPPRAERLDFTYTSAILLPTPLLFRLDKAGERLPMSRVVDGPDQAMRPITLLKPPPPLLSEAELVVAARLVHGAKVWFAAYARSISLRWDLAVLPLLAAAMLMVLRGWREQFMAAAAVGIVFFAIKTTAGTAWVERWSTVIDGCHAGLTLILGLIVVLRKGTNTSWLLLSSLVGAVWGLHISTWSSAAASPVLARTTVFGLEAMGYAMAWLGSALAIFAVWFAARDGGKYFQRWVPAAGCALTAVSLYWLVSVVRAGA